MAVGPRVLGPVVQVLGQPVGGCSVRELRRLAELLHVALVDPCRRIADGLGIGRAHQVGADRGFKGFVVLREWAFVHQTHGKQPGRAFWGS
jgi:hypothetical protein